MAWKTTEKPKHVIVSARITEEEFVALNEALKRNKMNVSDYIRERILV